MTNRCPSAKFHAKTVLKQHRLEFARVCTVVQDKRSVVPIVIWEISHNDLMRLDRYEGVNSKDRLSRFGSYRREIATWKPGKDVMIYVKNDDEPELPDPAYFKRVEEGYKRWAFDTTILEEAFDRAYIESTKHSKTSRYYFDPVF